MKRQRRYRGARQNPPRDQPIVHTFAQELAVVADDFVAEHAGGQ